jgi:hypothetical protein
MSNVEFDEVECSKFLGMLDYFPTEHIYVAAADIVLKFDKAFLMEFLLHLRVIITKSFVRKNEEHSLNERRKRTNKSVCRTMVLW